MRTFMLTAAAFAGMMTIAGCNVIPFYDEDKAEENRIRDEIEEAEGTPRAPIEHVESIELGRLYDGYMLTAFGIAPGIGYFEPALIPRYNGRPAADGFYEFDFMARPPKEEGVEGADAPLVARKIRADFKLTPEMLRQASGVRIWSKRDLVEGRF